MAYIFQMWLRDHLLILLEYVRVIFSSNVVENSSLLPLSLVQCCWINARKLRKSMTKKPMVIFSAKRITVEVAHNVILFCMSQLWEFLLYCYKARKRWKHDRENYICWLDRRV